MTKKTNNYEDITNSIIEALEKNVRPWIRPWEIGGVGSLPIRYNGEPYKGMNNLILWMKSIKKQYKSSYWMSFKQAKSLGGKVKKGEKATVIFYMGVIKNKDENQVDKKSFASTETEKKFMKFYNVFNISQIENLPDKYYKNQAEQSKDLSNDLISKMDKFIKSTGSEIYHGEDFAYYNEESDHIKMPDKKYFKSLSSYYATLFHELIHWTKSKTRLNRDPFSANRFGDNKYAFEELVAEIGSVFLCASLGIEPEIRDDHASYILSWLKVLESDKKAIFKAASLAQEAVDYLHSLQ